MTHTITHVQSSVSARPHGELCLADLDAIVGGAPVAATTPGAGAGKTPNLLVVIAIIAILIG